MNDNAPVLPAMGEPVVHTGFTVSAGAWRDTLRHTPWAALEPFGNLAAHCVESPTGGDPFALPLDPDSVGLPWTVRNEAARQAAERAMDAVDELMPAYLGDADRLAQSERFHGQLSAITRAPLRLGVAAEYAPGAVTLGNRPPGEDIAGVDVYLCPLDWGLGDITAHAPAIFDHYAQPDRLVVCAQARPPYSPWLDYRSDPGNVAMATALARRHLLDEVAGLVAAVTARDPDAYDDVLDVRDDPALAALEPQLVPRGDAHQARASADMDAALSEARDLLHGTRENVLRLLTDVRMQFPDGVPVRVAVGDPTQATLLHSAVDVAARVGNRMRVPPSLVPVLRAGREVPLPTSVAVAEAAPLLAALTKVYDQARRRELGKRSAKALVRSTAAWQRITAREDEQPVHPSLSTRASAASRGAGQAPPGTRPFTPPPLPPDVGGPTRQIGRSYN